MIEEDGRRRLAHEAARFKASGALGRSASMVRLFDYLVQRSLAEEAPKEIEIARAVFALDVRHDLKQDSSVRVYVHRLRGKLEEYYAGPGRDAPSRLSIAKGKYLVELASQSGPAPEAAPQVEVRPWRRWLLLAGWPVAAVAVVAALAVMARGPPATPLQAAAQRVQADPLWRALGRSGRPVLLVTGDYYIFGESSDGMSIDRLVRDFRIDSPDDLRRLKGQADADGMTSRDLGLYYLPVGAADGVRAVGTVLDGGAMRRADIVPMSSLTAEQMKSSDIIYVGYLSGLGMLRDAVFGASSLRIGQSYDELVDRATGQRYTADWLPDNSAQNSGKDYGYVASLRGPGGNHIIVVAGTRDVALRQSAETLTDAAALAALRRRLGGAADFEALFQVQGVGDLNMSSRMVLARPIQRTASWQPSATTFPDAPPEP